MLPLVKALWRGDVEHRGKHWSFPAATAAPFASHNGIVARALERGLIVNSTHDTVIRLLPPLILDKKLVDLGCKLLDELFTEAASQQG